MAVTSRCVLVVLLAVLVPAARTWTDEVSLNGTEQHLAKSAVADGELGSARSSVAYERRRIVAAEEYRPTYINGHNRRPAQEQVYLPANINGQSVPGPGQPEPAVDTSARVNSGEPTPSKAASGNTHSPNLSDKDVLETQHTTCHVTTEQLAATAQATVTRVLKGLCTSQEMETRFNDLVELITDRLSELKDVVVKLETRVDDYNEALQRGKYQQMETLVQHCDTPKPGTAALSVNDAESRGKMAQDGQKSYLADLYENEASGEEAGIREPEVQKYNSSIHIEPSLSGSPKKVFTYYWRIPQVQYKLTEWNPRRSFRSQSFYIYPGGYRLYLRCFPRQNEANFYVHVGVTKGDFDQALKWPFPLKMKVAILDQTRDTRMFEDITSRVWDPSQLCSEFNWQRPTKGDNYECVGLGFPHDILRQRGYVNSDSLVVKLTVYLDP